MDIKERFYANLNMLREDYEKAKKAVTGMDEEAEQLDELSRKTLGNYIKKAHKNTNKLTLTLDNPKAPKEYAKQAERKFRNRNKGIERAADKLSR